MSHPAFASLSLEACRVFPDPRCGRTFDLSEVNDRRERLPVNQCLCTHES